MSETGQGLSVEVATLDAFVARQGLDRLDAIKLDVEGKETSVLRGGNATLERFKPMLLVEFWPCGLHRSGTSAAELAAELEAAGYSLHDPKSPDLAPVTRLPADDDLVNILCFHRDRGFS